MLLKNLIIIFKTCTRLLFEQPLNIRKKSKEKYFCDFLLKPQFIPNILIRVKISLQFKSAIKLIKKKDIKHRYMGPHWSASRSHSLAVGRRRLVVKIATQHRTIRPCISTFVLTYRLFPHAHVNIRDSRTHNHTIIYVHLFAMRTPHLEDTYQNSYWIIDITIVVYYWPFYSDPAVAC